MSEDSIIVICATLAIVIGVPAIISAWRGCRCDDEHDDVENDEVTE